MGYSEFKGKEILSNDSKHNMKKLKRIFMLEQDGIGVVEIILILVVLIGLLIIFKDQLTLIVENVFKAIVADTDKIIK